MEFDIPTIVSKGLCTGCGMCAGISRDGSVSMRINASGYARPAQLAPMSSSAVLQLSQSCPAVSVKHLSTQTATHHELWGPLLSSHTAFSTEPEIRWKGSSGGVISALAWYLLATRRVDGVAQISADSSDPLRNTVSISRSREDILRAAGSRYAPASPLSNLSDWLDSSERLAFIGKPCDVAALRQLIRTQPALEHKFPYLLSFMCAGTPSLYATHQLLDAMGADRNQIVAFRYRGDGWPGTAKAEHRDGRVFETDYNSSWGQVLGRQLQFRCKICPDGTGEFADITCADAWYSEDGYPDFREKDGRSLVLVRNDRGLQLFDDAVLAGYLKQSPLAVSDIARMQPYQVTRKRMVLGRVIAAVLRLGAGPKYWRLGLIRATMGANPVDWLRQAWGTFRRALPEKQ